MRQFSLALGAMGLLVGFIIAISVLSGDDQGRVNLLYLLLDLYTKIVFNIHLSRKG